MIKAGTARGDTAAVAKPAQQFGHAMQFYTTLFISLEIDSLYRL